MSRDGDLKRWNIVSTKKKSDLIRRKKIRQRFILSLRIDCSLSAHCLQKCAAKNLIPSQKIEKMWILLQTQIEMLILHHKSHAAAAHNRVARSKNLKSQVISSFRKGQKVKNLKSPKILQFVKITRF